MGKALERIQAQRLAYYAAKFNLFPSNQFGSIVGHSAQDAVLSIVHNVEAAWNHNRTTTLLTFNITSYFEFIPHSYLIDMLRRFCIPLQIAKWVHSFIKDREASICLDRKKWPETGQIRNTARVMHVTNTGSILHSTHGQ